MDNLEIERLKEMTTDQLINIIFKHKEENKALKEKLNEVCDEVTKMREELKSFKTTQQNENSTNINAYDIRMTAIERAQYSQEQYSRRECVEIVGIDEKVKDEDLENKIVKLFNEAGVNVRSNDFHAVHRLTNSSTVIAKCVNRKNAISILKNKKVLRELDVTAKERLSVSKTSKLYINESLCSPYRILLGKCNALHKLNCITGFYTVNGHLKIRIGGEKNARGMWENFRTEKIGHISDLVALFGNDLIDSLKRPGK